MVARYEVTHLIPKARTTADPSSTKRAFNASLFLTDSEGKTRPYLAEAQPQLNTDTWRVFPDGRMETTYRLRPNLTWHDGTPLTADDFVFTWRVYSHPGLGVFPVSPQNLMEAVLAPDPRTLVIQWRAPYPDAAAIQMEDFDPVPRHIMEQPFANLEADPSSADGFLAHSYWMSEYVGAGPYRLVRWEPGASFEGAAFDGHVLGRPKVERIVIRIMPDDNVVLSNILAGAIDYAALRFEHGLVLQRDWVPQKKGKVILNRGGTVSQQVQLRPEYAGHQGLLDVRVRRAIAHSTDRAAVNDGVFEGQGFPTDTMASQTEPFYAELDRTMMHYPYDLRRTDQLMNEAGFAKDRDGFFANPAGDRYHLDFQTVAGSEFERVQLILTNGWRQAGIPVDPSILPSVQVRDGQPRHTFPGIATRGGSLTERAWLSWEVGSQDNRWQGDNRSGWVNAEYDRLWEGFTTTLDRGERTRQFIQMQRLLSEELPVLFTHFAVPMTIHISALKVPDPNDANGTGTLTLPTLKYWNMQEWEWQ